MFNLCKELRCPYSLKNGCDRYSVSNHCHLLSQAGQKRDGIETNQYWLFADEAASIDINQLRQENEKFLAADELTQERVELKLTPFDEANV
jgi:hypothetical protein